MGRLVPERPLRLFGLMEIAIGLYSLAVPFLFEGLGRFFVVGARTSWGIRRRPDWPSGSLTAVLALAPPTLLMGGTLPVLTRFAAAGRCSAGAGQRARSTRPTRPARSSAAS